MLDKHYKLKNGTLNPAQTEEKINEEGVIKKKWKNLIYYTKDFEDVFENMDNALIFADIAKQNDHIRKEIELYSKYEYFNKATTDKLYKQYQTFYFYKGYYYNIEELRIRLTGKKGAENTYIRTQKPTVQELQKKDKDYKPTLSISRQAIRNITGYSPWVIPAWDKENKKPIYIEWQDTILQDESNVILVDGSRQLGKTTLKNEFVKLANGQHKQAKNLVVGEKILSSNYGEQTIVGLKKSKKQTYKITLENGLIHQVTAEHRIPTSANFDSLNNKWDSNKLTNKENYLTAQKLYEKFVKNNKELDILKEKRRKNKIRASEDRIKQEKLQKEANIFVPTAFNYDDKIKHKTFGLTLQDCLLIGYFIGDGTRGDNSITGNHDRLFDNIDQYKITRTNHKNTFKYNIFKFKQSVIELEGFDVYSYEKFLDSRLFQLPTEFKWKIIEGLINTDGYIAAPKSGSVNIEYCSTSKQLINDLQSFLLQLGIICQTSKKKIKSNFKNHREFAYYLYITDSDSFKKIDLNVDIKNKVNYKILYERINNKLITKNGKHSLMPLEARLNINNSNKQKKKPNYPFQRSKIKTGYFKGEGLNNWLNYNWVKIKNIEFIEEYKSVVTVQVDSDDELYFSNNVLTHNSLTIAEKLVEISFLPNQDTLVGAFIKKTTDVIRNYMTRFINKFPEGTFEHYKSEGYILNTKSGTRIYFRTLDNGAENVLGLTLYNIIIDEAQLVEADVFEDVLEPTLATTDGKMILIGTPGRAAKGYYFDLIMECKRYIDESGLKIAVKNEENPDLSYYQIDYTQNPLISPRLRAKIDKNLHKSSYQRQYCCNWNSGEDQLFKPKKISKYPILSNDGYFVFTFDPARAGTDRSAYVLNYVYNGIVYCLLSGFIPKVHKKQWSRQIKFYANGLIKQFGDFKNVVYGVDLRGIGEGFTEAWKNHFKKPNPQLSLIEITYTSGDTETINGLEWRVSKTKLITNAVDYMDEGIVHVLSSANKDLLEEWQFLYEDEDRTGKTAMKTTFKDDIANAFMVSLYIIHTRGYLKRSMVVKKETPESLKEWNECFEEPKNSKRRKKNKKVW